MNINLRKVDHLVYCVPDLNTGITLMEECLGVKAIVGGKHLDQGTQNALINLGNQCYLEILAIDVNNTDVELPRWMGVDLLTSPKLTRWAIKTDDITLDQQQIDLYNPDLGQLIKGQRQLTSGKFLHWQMTKPLATPEVELMPFITDWSASDTHPTDQLSKQCELVDLQFFHPEPESIKSSLAKLIGEVNIKRSNSAKIMAIIDGPNGRVEI